MPKVGVEGYASLLTNFIQTDFEKVGAEMTSVVFTRLGLSDVKKIYHVSSRFL